MGRRNNLKAFREEWMEKKVVWGDSDCSAWIKKWVKKETGINVPLPEYSSLKQSLKLRKQHGGLLPMFKQILGAMPQIHPTRYPELGDIGCIEHGHLGWVGAIYINHNIVLIRGSEIGAKEYAMSSGEGYKEKRGREFWSLPQQS